MSDFEHFESLSPIVSTFDNFDSLLIPESHPARAKSDTYYINDTHLLRCHTSAHQHQLLKNGHEQFIVAGDVYRKDEINRTHFPVFHQIEGVKLFPKETPEEEVIDDLKTTLLNLIKYVFGKDDLEYRWNSDYFPFTHPSFELEIKYNGEWLEVLGCGVIQPKILKDTGHATQTGWAFGIGLERLAMKMFQIPDIRYFWSEDPRFLSQFSEDDYTDGSSFTIFKPYSKSADKKISVSFWILDESDYNDNDIFDMIRDVCGIYVENVSLVDEFIHPKTKLKSKCFDINLRHPDSNITPDMVHHFHEAINLHIKNNTYLKSRS